MSEPNPRLTQAGQLAILVEQGAVAAHRELSKLKASVWLRLPNGVDVIFGDMRYNNQAGVSIRLGEPQHSECGEPMKSAIEKALDWLEDPKVAEWINRSGYRTCGTGSYGDIVVGLRALLGKGNKDEGT